MSNSSARSVIRLRGVRHNNLKNFDLDLPLNRLIVITGLSGSGKSSLAFDTLFAEGQRRYIETFSPYARQFFDRMDKPQVDAIEGIPPAIAIEQRNAVKTTRSTVGTMTEICDYMKVLWPRMARLHCRQCGRVVRKDTPQRVWDDCASPASGARDVLITFDVPLSDKLSLDESLELVSKQGYQRLLLNGEPVRIRDAASGIRHPPSAITVIQDRLKLVPGARARFVEACEQAYHFGKGKLAVHCLDGAGGATLKFSNRLHCAHCDIEYGEPTPALFTFNHPVGACPTCRGFGRVISIDYDLALPDRSRTLAQGVVKPWQTGHGLESQHDLMKACRALGIPTDIPFEQLPGRWQQFVIDGEPGYGEDEEHEWPRAWYGVKGYFRWLESKAYKMHVRVLLSRYRCYTPCPDCAGTRFQPDALLYRLDPENAAGTIRTGGPGGERQGQTSADSPQLTLADFYALPIRDALALIERLGGRLGLKPSDPLQLTLGEVHSRLRYLNEVGLGYLTLDRPTRSLSGGETERVNLTTCLGTRLVNTLFVLDEPSVGLHPRDTDRLVRVLEQLRDAGNTVVVVEHEARVMRAADQIVDLGPGHGATGGQVVFQGGFSEILAAGNSLTGQYLAGRKRIELPLRRPVLPGVASQEAGGASVPASRSSPEKRWSPEKRLARTLAPPSREESQPAVVAALNEAVHPFRVAGKPNSQPSTLNPSTLDPQPSTLNPQPPGPAQSWLHLANVTRHNLRNVSVRIPLGRFVCVTGVSGSGKTTLMREALLPALEAQLRRRRTQAPARLAPKASERFEMERATNHDEEADAGRGVSCQGQPVRISGSESISGVILVDQSILGKTPRSNPAVYIGAFDDIRELFAQTEPARQRGLAASAFSFNSAQGQCERCRGAGFEKIEMQFLSDVFIRCPDCGGRRYRAHILEIKVAAGMLSAPATAGPGLQPGGNAATGTGIDPSRAFATTQAAPEAPPKREPLRLRRREDARPSGMHSGEATTWSIADVLDATVDEVVEFLRTFPESRPARRALQSLTLLQEVGLGYLRLGQPINTLSGGESQRLKLVRHLADSGVGEVGDAGLATGTGPGPDSVGRGRSLFLFDEPTTGLHFDDVRVLLNVFQRLVDAGHSVMVIEHNLDVIKSADWIIDLGPGAGDEGGHVVAEGTPEDVAPVDGSHTGRYLVEVLKAARPASRKLETTGK